MPQEFNGFNGFMAILNPLNLLNPSIRLGPVISGLTDSGFNGFKIQFESVNPC